MKAIFKLGLCGDWVEICETMPKPKFDGEFSLVFRRKWKRKCLTLFSGITMAGVKALIKEYRSPDFDPTNLILCIGDMLRQQEVLQRAKLQPMRC